MPDGRRLFVLLGGHYGVAQRYLKIETAAPASDEASLRASDKSLLENLAKLEKDGYAWNRLLLSYTNPLKYDNGSPVPGLPPFIAAGNKLGREPALRLTTATQALAEIETGLGGGFPFTPYRDQLPGSCRDYFAVDGWAHYCVPEGDWLWVTRDAPPVVVGGPHTASHHQSEPADPRRLLSMIFDNCWHTNFVAGSIGAMEFQLDLAWCEKTADQATLAETLVAEPVVVVNPAVRDTKALTDHLWRP
jgi:hypothetical protein